MITAPEFHALTYDEQVARLRRLGEAALCEFGVAPDEIVSLIHGENTTFRVDSSQGRFNLRISRPGYQSSANVRSEIAFLAALRAAGFRVPEPYQARVVRAAVPEAPEARDCVLFRWMDGEFSKGLTPAEAALLGETMARLHAFAADWTPPAGFDRQELHAWAFGERPPEPTDRPNPMMSEDDRALLRQVDRESIDLLRALPRTPEHYGLIHADLHRGNLLFQDGALSVIDFDDTSRGFWLYDFAAALAYEIGSEGYESARNALLTGYAAVRPLPPRTEETLDAFLRLRMAGICLWLARRSDNPEIRENGGKSIARLCGRIRSLRA